MKTATHSEELSSRAHGQFNTINDEAPSKIARILAHLLFDGSLNRFEAERLGDHCLPSTISDLAHGYGLSFQRQSEKVPNRWGAPCDVTRYSLPASERDKACKVLALLRKPTKKRQEVAA